MPTSKENLRNRIIYGQNLISFLNKDKGYYLDFDGTIKPKHDQPQRVIGFPWIFSGGGGKMRCPIWQTLHFGTFNMIPSYCLGDCWKVVIIPKGVNDLLTVHQYLESFGFESKAGLDMRPYTFGMYRGFIYCATKDEAKEKENYLGTTLHQIAEYSVYTKRGCTEYENKIAPSDQWKERPHQKNLETLLEADVDQGISEIKEPHFKQPEWAKDLIRLHWVQSAYASGDRSWKATPYADFISKSISPIIY